MLRRGSKLSSLILVSGLMLIGIACVRTSKLAAAEPQAGLQKRWVFFWRDLSNPKEFDETIALFPKAKADGYNGVALSCNIPAAKAAELKEAAKKNGLDIVAIVMGGSHDKNYCEGLLAKDAVFVAQNGKATLQPDKPKLLNGDFEDVKDNHFSGWTLQDDDGVTSFADHTVVHGGKTSLRMESIGKNQYRHCRMAQPIKLLPHREYHVSVWIKTEKMAPADPEIKVLVPTPQSCISFQTFHTEGTQDWKKCDVVFNSLDGGDATLYLGSWSGKDGKVWWDDLILEEIGLVNVLRRPGCPVTVTAEDGTAFEEGKDFEQIVDPNLHPWIPYHEQPAIKLTANSRIKDGQKLKVSYYHSVVVYEDRVTSCLSEQKIFDEWRTEVKQVEDLIHPAAFLMSHDELRVINQCALCQSKKLTAGKLLAWNVREAAKIIRQMRPDAGIWVWNDMFDPQHNALDQFYLVNGSLKGSWEGLDKDVGIVNWNGGLVGKNCQFFADLGLKQILSGYYDGDEDGSQIAKWLDATKGVSGIAGVMYTTWESKYGALDAWAKKAWGK